MPDSGLNGSFPRIPNIGSYPKHCLPALSVSARRYDPPNVVIGSTIDHYEIFECDDPTDGSSDPDALS